MYAKEIIITALNNDQALTAEVKSITAGWINLNKELPQITVTLTNLTPISYSDDIPDLYKATIQIDTWSKANPFIISDMVINILADIETYPTAERELNEADINRVMLEYEIVYAY